MYAQGMTRRAFVTLGATALAMGLFGCGRKGDSAAGGGTDATEGSESKPVMGGWEVNADFPMSVLSDEQQAVFDRATEGYVGMDLQPVCVLGTQVVAGTNYAFLCVGTPVVAEPEAGWYVAVVYEDLKGGCEIRSVEQIDVSEPALAETADESEAVLGGWAVTPKVTDDSIAIAEDAASAFVAGGEGYVGMDLRPLALLATQVVAGTNYRILCVGAPVVPDAESGLYVVDVYEDLEGKAKYSDVSTFNLLAYV